MPEIEAVDTMLVACHNGLPSSLKNLCGHYGIGVESHHDASCDAAACMEVFLRLKEEFGPLESSVWIARDSPHRARGHHEQKRVFNGLGLVNASQETIESVLKKAEEAGRRGDPSEIDDPTGLRVRISGVTPGYTRDEILVALRACGMDAKNGKPVGKTQYLAIGDNVGVSKLAPVFDGTSPAKIVTTGELLEVMNRFGGVN